jgi:hypothetical protein
MRRTHWVLAGILVVASCALWAPFTYGGEFSALSGPRVTLVPISPVVIVRGGRAKVNLQFEVSRGFHINSNQPRSESLVPTTLALQPPADMLIGKLSYPEGQDYRTEWATEGPLSVYAGPFDVSAQIIPTKEVNLGSFRVHGVLRYQACDNRQCYPPRRLPVEFEVKIVDPPQNHVVQNPGQSPHAHNQ